MIFHTAQKHRLLFFILVLLTLCYFPIGFLQPLMLKNVIDSLISNTPTLVYNIMLFLAFYVGGVLLTTLTEIVGLYFNENVAYDVEKGLFKKILYSPFDVIRKYDKGELMGRAFYDNYLIKQVLHSYLDLFQKTINFILYTVLLFYLLGTTALFVPLIFIPFGIIYFKFSKVSAEVNLRVRNQFERTFIVLSSFISGIKYITAHRNQMYFSKRMERAVDDLKNGYIAFDKKALVSRLSFSLMEMLVFLIFLILSVYLFKKNNLTVGTLTAVISFIHMYVSSVKMIFVTIYQLKSNKGLYSKVNEIWEIAAEKQQGIVPERKLHDITFNNVKFAYTTSNTVLDIEDLRIERKKYALIGRTGAGKTTFINLLFKLIPAQEGSIQFNGIDIKGLNPAWYKEHGLYVFQENILFNLSLKENIMINIQEEGEKTTEKLYKITKDLGLSDFFLEKEYRLDELIADCGDNFSGGEKRFISIVRALLQEHKPQLIVFDEPFENLDQQWRKVIDRLIQAISEDAICITISHSFEVTVNFPCP